MPDELFITISTITGRRLAVGDPHLVDRRRRERVDGDGAALERDPRATLRHVERVGDAEDAGLERERLAVGAVARDRLQRLGHDDGALGLLVDAVEQLAHLRLGEEEAPVLVVASVDRHADVVQERREHDDDLGVVASSSGSRAASDGCTPCFTSWRRSFRAMLVTIWMCTHEWSLIWSRTTALTFATCHHALSCGSAFDVLEQAPELAVPARGHAEVHGCDRLGRRQRAPPATRSSRRPEHLDDVVAARGRVEPSLVSLDRLAPPRRASRDLRRPVAVQARVRAGRAISSSCVPAVDDPAVVEDDDQVGAADRREPVRDDERRPSREEPAQAALDAPLGADVDRRGRFVEDEDPRIGEQRARERDELALAEREPEAALADLRVVPVRQLGDERVRADGRRRRLDLRTRGVGPSERDVVGDRAREQEALLRDDPELAAERRPASRRGGRCRRS